ncbi:MAG: hypothetical protein AAF384_15275 [Pseudomonadota bacterium]
MRRVTSLVFALTFLTLPITPVLAEQNNEIRRSYLGNRALAYGDLRGDAYSRGLREGYRQGLRDGQARQNLNRRPSSGELRAQHRALQRDSLRSRHQDAIANRRIDGRITGRSLSERHTTIRSYPRLPRSDWGYGRQRY